MSVPPPPNQWGSQPPTGGQPQWGGPPEGGQAGGAAPWGPQQQWSAPPPPPPRGGKGKWILAGIAVLAVIAVAVVVTVLIVRPDSDRNPPTQGNGSGSEIASADDNGPANVITEDPTCVSWSKVGTGLTGAEEKLAWGDRDPAVPASAWTPQQRTMYQTIANAMRAAADQTVGLVKLTPHRVMRELYEQFIAYARGFADSVAMYTADDRYLAMAADGLVSVPGDICGSITYGSAIPQVPLIPVPKPPSKIPLVGDPANPQRFLATADAVCAEWRSVFDKFNADTSDWRSIDPNIPAAQWNPDQKAVVDAVGPVMTAYADKAEELGRRTNNPTLQDFAVLSAQYRRAYVTALPAYNPADNYLVSASTYLAMAINSACSAAQG